MDTKSRTQTPRPNPKLLQTRTPFLVPLPKLLQLFMFMSTSVILSKTFGEIVVWTRIADVHSDSGFKIYGFGFGFRTVEFGN